MVAVQALSSRGGNLQPHGQGKHCPAELGSPGVAEKWECFVPCPCHAWALWRLHWLLCCATDTVTNPGCPGKHVVLGAPQPSCSLPCHCQLVSPAQQHTWDTLHVPNPRVWVGLPNRHRPHTVPRVPWMCRWPQGSTQRPRAHARPLCPHQRRYGSEREMPRRWSQALLFSVNH